MHDEFVGPFPSWIDVRRDHRAVGDGVADDTAALQAALDRLRVDSGPRVVFLPAGSYRITRTLRMAELLGVGLIGEDPATTRLVWDGPAAGIMLEVAGMAYSRINRLAFDGRRRASVAVEQAWDNQHGPFDTGNEYADDWFIDVDYGLHGGFKGHGFAETSVMRARFLRNSKAGIALGNFNALDLWVWHSLFEDCGIGVTNEPGAGNYRVYGSIFRRSAIADLMMQNTGGFTARDNYSVGSKAFWTSGPPINHPAQIDIQGNTIVDPQGPVVVRMGNQGPGLIMDNRVRSLPNTAGPIVSWSSLFGSDVMSIGNTFTVSGAVAANGRLVAIDDRIVTRDRIDVSPPALPGVQPNRKRRVYEVPPGAPAAAIQAAIDAAVQDGTPRPVVHLPPGTYAIDRTLIVPPSGLQLVGDGSATVLRWTGRGRGPVVALASPTRATLRELQVDGESSADGIVATDLDTPGSHVYLEGVQLRGGTAANLFVDAVDRTTIDLVDFGHAYSPSGTSVRIVGGASAGAGGRTVIHSGAAAGHRLSYEVAGGATLVARDIWYEGKADGGFVRLEGAGAFTMQNARVNTPAGWTPAAFTVDGFAGRAALLTTLFDDRLVVSGDGSRTDLAVLASVREAHAAPLLTNTTPPARALVVNVRQRVPATGLLARGTVAVTDVGRPEAAVVRRLLEDTRGVRPLRLTDAPAGASDLRMFRVWVSKGQHNVVLRGGR